MLGTFITFVLLTLWTLIVFFVGIFFGHEATKRAVNDLIKEHGENFIVKWKKKHQKE